MKVFIRMKREVKEKEKKKEATSVYVSADYWITSGYRVIRHLSRLDILAWNLVEGLRVEVYESTGKNGNAHSCHATQINRLTCTVPSL